MKSNNNLELSFSSLLNGKSFEEWVDFITDKSISSSQKESFETDLKKLLPYRNITKVSFEKSVVRGRLSITTNGFELVLSEYLRDKLNDLRFVVAHEIAHTYFFDINSSPPKHLIFHSQGSNELEFACNIIARSLLLPKDQIKNEHHKFLNTLAEAKFQQRAFLPFIFETAKKFQVNWSLVLTRFINDLKLPNTIILEFREPRTPDYSNWYLNSLFISHDLTKKGLFLPFPSGKKKKPSARNFILKLIKIAVEEYKRTDKHFYSHNVQVSSFTEDSFGNMKHFLELEYKTSLDTFFETHSCVTNNGIFNAEKKEWETQKGVIILLTLPITIDRQSFVDKVALHTTKGLPQGWQTE